MIRRPPRSTQSRSSAASDVYKRQQQHDLIVRTSTKKCCRRIILQEDVVVPARSEVNVPCKVVFSSPLKCQGTSWSTRPSPIKSGVYVARSLTPEDRYDIPVRVMNVQQSPCVIKARTEVGELEVVEVVSDFGGTSSGSCLLYTSPSPRDGLLSRMPSSA